MTFEAWLDGHQLHSPALRWFLDSCCRNDYGAGIGTASAWAGLPYFASRHGFSLPGGEATAEKEAGVLTWPQDNGWLTQQLAAPLGQRLHTGRVVLRIDARQHGVVVDALNVATQQVERRQAEHRIACLPLFVAARAVHPPRPRCDQRPAACVTPRGWSPTCTCRPPCTTGPELRPAGTTWSTPLTRPQPATAKAWATLMPATKAGTACPVPPCSPTTAPSAFTPPSAKRRTTSRGPTGVTRCWPSWPCPTPTGPPKSAAST